MTKKKDNPGKRGFAPADPENPISDKPRSIRLGTRLSARFEAVRLKKGLSWPAALREAAAEWTERQGGEGGEG